MRSIKIDLFSCVFKQSHCLSGILIIILNLKVLKQVWNFSRKISQMLSSMLDMLLNKKSHEFITNKHNLLMHSCYKHIDKNAWKWIYWCVGKDIFIKLILYNLGKPLIHGIWKYFIASSMHYCKTYENILVEIS